MGMIKSARNQWVATSLLVSMALLGLMGGCNSATPPAIAESPVISDPMISDPTPQQPGKEVGISIDVSSAGGVTLHYTWNADGGEIVRGQGSPAITYRVPDEPGTYNIRVKVEWDGQSVEKVTSIEVEGEPTTPTNTPSPTHTSQPTSTPQPTSIPKITRDQIAFVSDRTGTNSLYLMDTDGANQTLLVTGLGDALTSWSPDGKYIVCESDRDGNFEIYKVGVDSGSLTRLTNHPAKDYEPAWSPDGKYIAFMSERDGNPEIYIMDTEGTILQRLTDNPATDKWPTWSPDGQQIAFQSDRHGNLEIYKMETDGSKVIRLTLNQVDDFHPAWSPDGTRIAFASYRDEKLNIYLMNTDGSDVIKLTYEGYNWSPGWAPDGKYIVFASNRSTGNDGIYIMRDAGAEQACFACNASKNWAPAWSP